MQKHLNTFLQKYFVQNNESVVYLLTGNHPFVVEIFASQEVLDIFFSGRGGGCPLL